MKKAFLTLPFVLLFALLTARIWLLPALPTDWLGKIASVQGLGSADLGLIAHELYEDGQRSLARDIWLKSIGSNTTWLIGLSSSFDIGNTYFEEGLENGDIKEKTKLLLQAKSFYEQALKFGDDAETKANLEAVIKLLEELQKQEEEEKAKKEEEKKKQEEQSGDSGSWAQSSWSGAQTWTGTQSGSGSQSQSGSTNTQTGSGSNAEQKEWQSGFTNSWQTESLGRKFGTGTGEILNPVEKELLDAARDRILDLQRSRSKYTRPDGTVPPRSRGSLYEEFLKSDPMFQWIENGTKKDW